MSETRIYVKADCSLCYGTGIASAEELAANGQSLTVRYTLPCGCGVLAFPPVLRSSPPGGATP